MAELEQSTKPVLQRPPGYRDPSNPVPRPPLRKGVDVTLGNDQGTELGSTTLPGFTHAKRNTTSLKIETQLKNQLIDDATGSRLKTRYKSRNLVVNVRVKTSVGLGVVKGFKIGMLAVAVLCDGITLKEDDGGHMPRCTIRTLKW
ncbi:hypothetical protein P3X46_014837 [Hevea brasiliensis]|uniref:Uncharacterized protein n=1 Tax=Hevea brasiliensis TaxID=3981 RepID=A0ABQ9LXY1_HEVBR|nr:hypothetical protein P3X46_014837 [Hevea brasiliensis]